MTAPPSPRTNRTQRAQGAQTTQRADCELPLRIARTAAYIRLRRKSADPDGEHPASIRALAKFIPCAHRLLYARDPKSEQIRRVLKKSGDARRAPRVPPSRGAGHVPPVALTTQAERALARVSEAARRWLDARDQDAGLHAIALAVGDLDLMVRSVLAAQAEFRPLAAEIQRREQAARLAARGGVVSGPPQEEQTSLL
jgi:hypothetical protein